MNKKQSEGFEWNQLFFFWLRTKIYDIEPEEAKVHLEEMMKDYPDFYLPTFEEPLLGDGFRIYRENKAIRVDIDDIEKARGFYRTMRESSEISQDQIVLLVAAAILQVYIDTWEG